MDVILSISLKMTAEIEIRKRKLMFCVLLRGGVVSALYRTCSFIAMNKDSIFKIWISLIFLKFTVGKPEVITNWLFSKQRTHELTQPRPQGISLKKWVSPHPFFKGKALGTRLELTIVFLWFSSTLFVTTTWKVNALTNKPIKENSRHSSSVAKCWLYSQAT